MQLKADSSHAKEHHRSVASLSEGDAILLVLACPSERD